MIKSILEDEDPPEDSPKKKRRLLGKRRPKDDLLSIGLTSNDTEKEEPPGESEEEIKNGILGISGPDPGDRTVSAGQSADDNPVPEGPEGADAPESTGRAAELEKMLKELEEELRQERESEERSRRYATETGTHRRPEREPGNSRLPVPRSTRPPLSDGETEPESQVETFRKMGLAWSAAIALFGSVVFMLAIGWVADVLLGSSPWGIVTGIVIGAGIGFLQFFRITSQLTGRGPGDFEKLSLKTPRDQDPPEAGTESKGTEEDGPSTV
ncbi:MAG TPA: AtpZ/AtpI family protein [Aridibacter sp.]|nr:AtpZ/AtpI family protein [Aridibacter sp.]